MLAILGCETQLAHRIIKGQWEDMLHVVVGINFSRRKRKMQLGQDLLQEQIKTKTPNPLTRRELLSQVAGLYDPMGIVTPVKQKIAIMVRRAFQEAKEGSCLVRDTWDMALSDGLREDAIKLFEEYAQLGKVKFVRALTPSCSTTQLNLNPGQSPFLMEANTLTER